MSTPLPVSQATPVETTGLTPLYNQGTIEVTHYMLKLNEQSFVLTKEQIEHMFGYLLRNNLARIAL